MARLFTASHETGSYQSEGYGTPLGVGNVFATDKAYTQTRALKLPSASPALGVQCLWPVTLAFTTNRDYYMAASFYVASGTPSGTMAFMGVGNDTTGVYIEAALHADGNIFLDTIDCGVCPRDQWFTLELRHRMNSAADDTANVRVNGVDVGTTRTAALSASAQIYAYVLANDEPNDVDVWCGHLIVNDDQGADENTWPKIRKVWLNRPVSDPGTSSANWIKPGGATTNRHTSVDNAPPVFETYDGTSGSAEDYLSNAVSGANAALLLTGTAYRTLGITGNIELVQAVSTTGGTSATDTAGDIGISANPVVAQLAFAAFDNGIASATETTWPLKLGTISYNPAVDRAVGPTVQVRKVTATTRVAIVNMLGVLIDEIPATRVGVDARRSIPRFSPPSSGRYG